MLIENSEKLWEKIKMERQYLDPFRKHMNFLPIIALRFYFGLTSVYTLQEIKVYSEVKHKKTVRLILNCVVDLKKRMEKEHAKGTYINDV